MIFCVKVYTQIGHYGRIFCMKQFKKRTIALVLASVVTVAGAFAADNYKNTLMGIDFSRGADNSVNVILRTKRAFENPINPVRKDANTYVIVLPEVYNQATEPDLLSVRGIENVGLTQMPYTNYGKGYTRIVIHTNEAVSLVPKNELYIATEAPERPALTTSEDREVQRETTPRQEVERQNRTDYRDNSYRRTQEENVVEQETSDNTDEVEEQPVEQSKTSQDVEKPAPIDINTTPTTQSDSTEAFLLVMAIFLILIISVFFYVKAKNKLTEIAGEQIKIDVDDEDSKAKKAKQEKKKKSTKIRAAIKDLDKKYPSPSRNIAKSEYTQPVVAENPTPEHKEEITVVDLDELFQEKKRAQETSSETISAESNFEETDEAENQALDDFLNGFSFEDDKEEVVEEEPLYNEELYEKVVADDGLKFTKDDAEMINKLLRMEINDETMRNIKEYAVSNPIKKEPSKREILEDFVTSYTISQNITFTNDDIAALNKIISVEIDKDFLADLKTNPKRAEEMAQEINKKKARPHKSSEILTLNVKDMLPDLSEALRKQGGKRIESEVKPVTVYYSEGYDVSTISLKNQLPDLSVEINNKDAYTSKPSAEIQLAETGYDVQKLDISNQLPDLKDVMAHPEKYEDPKPEEVVVDEEALLKNISNVQFKPFYDGSEEFEVLNDFDDKDTPTVSDIQKEFSQFGNFEISEEETVENVPLKDDYDDFESLYNNEFVDLDKNKSVDDSVLEELVKENEKPEPKPEIKPIQKPTTKQTEPEQKKATVNETKIVRQETKPMMPKPVRKPVSEELQRKIEQTRAEREARKADLALQKAKAQVTREITKCICDGKTYAVISAAAFDEGKGCYLVKNDSGYAVLGYVGDRLFELKQYATLKSEKIQARNSEKLPDGTLRYLVRIGLQKFIVDVKDSDIKYVMDLC